MSKEPLDKNNRKEGTRRPVPSKVNDEKKTGASGGVRRSDGRSSIKRKKKRRRNEIALSGDRNYGDPYNTPDMVEKDAEKILKKSGQRESSLHYVKPLPPAKKPISSYRRKLRRILFYGVTLLIVLSVFAVLSLTVFFKIDEIIVDGDTRYDHDAIIKTSRINTGENLIMCNTSAGENDIWKEYPFIEYVSIEKKLVNRVIIHVREAIPTSVIESEGNYVLLSESGKIVDISEKIGTYETSIRPYEDCCTIFVAKHPVTKPTLEQIEESEKKLEGIVEPILERAMETKTYTWLR